MAFQRLTVGKALMAASQVLICAGSFIADFNETHVLNPRWPPHAKFHNGQTMTLSFLLSSTSLYLIFRDSPTSAPARHIDDLFLAALVGGFYKFAGLCAIQYPGTAWSDPEFRKDVNVDEPAQVYIFGGLLVMLWVGWAVERRRVGGMGGEKKNL